MTVKLGQNIASLGAQRQLAKTSTSLSDVFERLSSGLRINSASDDAAGLSVASQLQSDTRIYTQAIRNANDGISALRIADDTLSELSDVVIRLKELAQQSANGVYGAEQRQALGSESDALVAEYNRIVESTEFNGTKLLDGSSPDLNLQVGKDGSENSQIRAVIASGLSQTVGDGTFGAANNQALSGSQTRSFATGDVDGDGLDDILFNGDIWLSDGDGTFTDSGVGIIAGASRSAELVDINNDGVLDAVYALGGNVASRIGNGDGTFGTQNTQGLGTDVADVATADIDGDGNLDLIATSYTDDTISTFLGNGNGTFQSGTSYSTGDISIISGNAIVFADFDQDGDLDVATNARDDGEINVFFNQGGGVLGGRTDIDTGQAQSNGFQIADVNSDGYVDLISASYSAEENVTVSYGQAGGAFASAEEVIKLAATAAPTGLLVQDLNGDGIADISVGTESDQTIENYLGDGNGAFSLSDSIATAGNPAKIRSGDFNGDEAVDLVSLNVGPTFDAYLANTQATSLFPQIDLLSQSGAREAIGLLDERL